MKKFIALVLSLVCVFSLAGCNTNSMNYIIENKPSVTGIVEEVHDDYIIMYSETAEGYPNGTNWSISLNVENRDSYTDIIVGDEIVVYYDGMAAETDPLQVSTVYAITLKTPAERIDRTENDASNELDVNELAEEYPLFFDLPIEGGLTVYIWQMAEGSYSCYLVNTAEEAIADNSFVYEIGTSIDEMNAILDTYDIDQENVTIQPITNPLSSYCYEINDDYRSEIKKLFWERQNE